PQPRHKTASRSPRPAADASRGRSADPKPDADRGSDGAWGLDTLQHQSGNPARRSQVPRQVRADAGLRVHDAALQIPRHPALADPAAEIREPAVESDRSEA